MDAFVIISVMNRFSHTHFLSNLGSLQLDLHSFANARSFVAKLEWGKTQTLVIELFQCNWSKCVYHVGRTTDFVIGRGDRGQLGGQSGVGRRSNTARSLAWLAMDILQIGKNESMFPRLFCENFPNQLLISWIMWKECLAATSRAYTLSHWQFSTKRRETIASSLPFLRRMRLQRW